MAEGSFQLAQAGPARTTVAAGGAVPLTRAQIAQAVLTQQGNDLLITLPNGAVVQVSGFFGGPAVSLVLADGAVVTPAAVAASITSGTPPLPAVGDAAGLPSSPISPTDPSGGGLRGALRAMAGDSLDSLLGVDSGPGRSDAGRDLPPLQLASLGPSALSLSDLVPGQRIAAEVAANAAQMASQQALAAAGGGGTGQGGSSAGGGGGSSLTAPTAGLSRAPFAQDAGNPGDSSPALVGLPQVGTSGNDTFNGTTNTYNTPTFNSGANTFSIDDNSGAVTFSGSGTSFTYNGQTILIGNPATTFGGDWFTRPLNDTYSGLGGNDTITGGSLTFGSGQDLLLGDFDLPASFGRLTTSTADDGPGTPGNDSLVGGSGADTLFGGGGLDTLMGGRDDDLLIVTDLNFALVDGGFGGDNSSTGSFPSNGLGFFPAPPANVTQSFDTLRIAASDLTIDLGQNSLSTKIQNIEGIDLATNGRNVFRATAAQIDSITNEDTNNDGNLGPDNSTAFNDKTDTLFITGDNTDTVQLTGGGWGLAASGISGTTLEINVNTTFSRYTNTGGSDGAGDTITVYVQTAVAVQLS